MDVALPSSKYIYIHEHYVHSTLAKLECYYESEERYPHPHPMYWCMYTFVLGEWIRSKFEPPGVFQMTNEEKKILLARLVRSTR